MTPLQQSGCSPLLDSGLRCPGCGYNLTGLTESRCPECGCAFDPDELRARLENGPRPIPIWDDREVHVLSRFARVCLMTWFTPGRFGRTFPRRYDPASTRAFRRLVVQVAAMSLPVCVALTASLYAVVAVLLSLIAALAGAIACERILGAVLDAILSPHRPADLASVPDGASESWRGLVEMFRSFFLLSILVTGLGETLGATAFSVGVLLIVAVWWWVCLGISIAIRPAAWDARGIVIILIPVVAAVSVIIGGITAGALGAMCGT